MATQLVSLYCRCLGVQAGLVSYSKVCTSSKPKPQIGSTVGRKIAPFFYCYDRITLFFVPRGILCGIFIQTSGVYAIFYAISLKGNLFQCLFEQVTSERVQSH